METPANPENPFFPEPLLHWELRCTIGGLFQYNHSGMKFLHKYGTRTNEVRRARRELYFRLSLVLAVLLFFAAMVVITKFRPRLDEEQARRIPTPSNMGDPMTNPQLILLRAEIDDQVAVFQDSLEGREVDLENLERLEEAIAKQREVIRLRGSEIAPKADLERLEHLLSLYDEHMGQFLIAQSLNFEERAHALMEARQYTDAVEALTRARNLQEEVNELYPRASARDSTRLHRLNNQVTAWQTRPIADEADFLKDRAYSLVAEGRYQEAREKIQQALDKQKLLNEDHRDSRYATLARLRQMESAWKEIQAAEDVDRVNRLMKEATAALDSEQTVLALARAEEAEILQRRIMERYPEVAAANAELLGEIQSLEDTAASLPAFNRIQDMQKEVRDILRTRRMGDFKNAVSEWLRATRDFQRAYPGSRFAQEINDAEVTFLHVKREEIPTILETLYANLVPVPGQGRMHLYRTEIPQALYTRITGENPSSSKDPQLPVESVTWREAKDFADKLGWIMARQVSLPSRELFNSALGTMARNQLDRRVWSSENSDRNTQPVGTSEPNDLGFHDLLGNVSEWIDASSEEPQDRVLASGGSARDTTIRLATMPEESREPSERNRFVGFRIAVDMGQ